MRNINKNTDICEVITKNVEHVIIDNKLIDNNDKLILAVSGGPDSMCLLSVLLELKDIFSIKYNINYNIIVAHVNHMIREESEQEKIYVENFCQNYGIKFYYLKENIPELSDKYGMSEETCGRHVRYNFFEKIRLQEDAQKIVVAHNQDDNVETILLNILRGCGLNGLLGMPYVTDKIIRPLIDIEKKDILEYNNLKQINPCIDKTNFEDIYLRNKIRLNLIPEIRKNYNSNISSNIIRMRNILSQDEDFLSNYTNNIVSNSIVKKDDNFIRFDYKNLINEHISIQNRAIRKIIELNLGNLEGIENIHIQDILKLLNKNIPKKIYIIGNKFTIEIISKNIAVIKNNK